MYETWVVTFTSKHVLRKLFEIIWIPKHLLRRLFRALKETPSHQVWLDDFGCLGVDPLWEFEPYTRWTPDPIRNGVISPLFFNWRKTKCLVNCGLTSNPQNGVISPVTSNRFLGAHFLNNLPTPQLAQVLLFCAWSPSAPFFPVRFRCLDTENPPPNHESRREQWA